MTPAQIETYVDAASAAVDLRLRADQHRARALEPPHEGRIAARRRALALDLRTGKGRQTRDVEQVLHREGHAQQRQFAGAAFRLRQRSIDLRCAAQRTLADHVGECVDATIGRADAVQAGLHQRHRADGVAAHGLGHRRCVLLEQRSRVDWSTFVLRTAVRACLGRPGAAVAAGQVALTLGSDTNGSIRVPSSLCGVFGLKPTFGRLPRTGSYPFVSSLDHLGPFARSVRDLALAYDAMQGPETSAPHDPGCAQRDAEPVTAALSQGAQGLRIGILGGYFRERAQPEALTAVDVVAQALGASRTVDLPMVEAGRAAAFLITNSEGAALHLPDLRTRAQDFEPLSRDRFLAGALLPAAWVARAQRVRRLYAEQVARLFERFDILLAAAQGVAATPIGAEWFELNGQRLPVRPNMGVLTQPISCIGLPVCAVPVWGAHPALPIGVQVIAPPWREDLVLRVAAALESAGVVQSPVATL